MNIWQTFVWTTYEDYFIFNCKELKEKNIWVVCMLMGDPERDWRKMVALGSIWQFNSSPVTPTTSTPSTSSSRSTRRSFLTRRRTLLVGPTVLAASSLYPYSPVSSPASSDLALALLQQQDELQQEEDRAVRLFQVSVFFFSSFYEMGNAQLWPVVWKSMSKWWLFFFLLERSAANVFGQCRGWVSLFFYKFDYIQVGKC